MAFIWSIVDTDGEFFQARKRTDKSLNHHSKITAIGFHVVKADVREVNDIWSNDATNRTGCGIHNVK
ncbi:hypothetical protein BC829DRAFT_392799 [Chytridium lagenaria]|nr:hypothetical protein BC829DRAFT_392799 [Chytridium lagenaria]